MPVLEMMPALMFGGLVVFLLLGFPVAFSLCAVGLFFGFISIELGFFTTAYLATCRCGCSASCPTTCCWRSRSSP
jgi:TRAP-type mannitol/chloroaromatic compound transport system permease large subunit